MTLPLTYAASVFLDRYGRYAKDPSEIATVRLFTGTGCGDYTDLTVAAYKKLNTVDRSTIDALPGRPECIETEGKSNA